MAFIKRHIKFFILVLLIGIWSYFLYRVSPQELINKIGVTNGYLISFFVAFVGGLSNFVNFPYQLIIFSLGAAGLSPLLLGITSGSGEFLGDSVSYFIGYHGSKVLPKNLQSIFKRFTNWCIRGPKWLVTLALFLYGAFIPLPNDFIIFPLSLGHYPYFRMMIPLALGNVFFNTMIALGGLYGYHR